ncbi:MAG: hypothetical protein Q9191_003864 [Dirinaria sp. TL-2023a]
MGRQKNVVQPPLTLPKTHDPVLTDLFASSLGPVKTNQKDRLPSLSKINATPLNGAINQPGGNTFEDGATSGEETNMEVTGAAVLREESVEEEALNTDSAQAPEPNRKRKRKHLEDNIEGTYMQKLAKEEAREEAKRPKQQRVESPATSVRHGSPAPNEGQLDSGSFEIVTGEEGDETLADVPRHETLDAFSTESGLEKAARTVFLGNVSTTAIKSKQGKKVLLEHLSSFLPTLADQTPNLMVESLRFRSTAFSSTTVPKKAAFARKELMDSTTQSTNAYAVYTTQLAAREATKRLNGTMVLDRHLRVDSVAHPAKIDHRRCVFVGNLSFVDDESSVNAAADEANSDRPRKRKQPADAEEGLWRQFSKAGTVESVRVIRDKTTRVGKGFAYVQFTDPNGVEKALLYDGKKFPPLLPRMLRVTRAKNVRKTGNRPSAAVRPTGGDLNEAKTAGYRPKIPSEVRSLSGRAGKLLGRAGAAQVRGSSDGQRKPAGVLKSPETLIFEGYRASSRQGKGTLKLGGSGKKQGKPRTRSSKRGAAFKASGKKKKG